MIFRKTTQGQEELRNRQAGLGARERSVLILVNGETPVAALAAQLGPDVRAVLDTLASRGLVEPISPAIAPAPAPVPAPPAAAPAPVASAADPFAAQIAAAKQRALSVLAEVYGPEAHSMVGDLLAARSLKDMQKALKTLEETLVMYQGRKHATLLIDRITGHG